MQGWVPYVVIGLVAAALIALTVVLARLAWRKQVRRYLIGLVGRREAISAALKTVDGVMAHIASGTVEDLLRFAHEPSEDRDTLAEVASRMRIEASELADLALPKRLWDLADALGAASGGLAKAASGVGEAEGEAVLDALGELDLGPVREALTAAEGMIGERAGEYGLTEAAVYGGGLYI